MTPWAWVLFVVAAAVGAPARYLIDGLVQDRTSGAFPWGTFAVNVSGCFLLGILVGLATDHGLDPNLRMAIGTGGIGAYTTFSTFTYETVRLAEEGTVNEAVRNVVGNLLAGLGAASAGLVVVSVL